MADIDLCGLWGSCSIDGLCVSTRYKGRCSYGIHLAQGINFLNPDFKAGPYLDICDRIFYIGERVNGGSVRIRNVESLPMLQFGIFSLSKTIIEHPSDEDPCSYRVVAVSGINEYNILNFNIRALTQRTALMIRDALRSRGLPARIEQIGISASRRYKPANMSSESAVPALSSTVAESPPKTVPAGFTKPLIQNDSTVPPPLPGQISFFDPF